jgi:hypothetical protein
LHLPREDAQSLTPTLSIVCEPCVRRERYAVARLFEEHGDAKLTDLLQTLADCPKARSASIRHVQGGLRRAYILGLA